MEHDAWFFLGVFIFIFLIWIATGGPLHPLSFAGPGLAQPGVLGGGTYLSLPRAPMGVGNSNVSLPGSSDGGGGSLGQGGPNIPDFVGGSVFGNPSPYRGLVTMNHSVSGAGSLDPKNEYIQLYVSQSAGVPIDISGWEVISDATGNAAFVPRGTEVPVSGTVNAAQDIVLAPGTHAYLITGSSPIGASFRENKCIGYFSTFQTFYPALAQNCPDPSRELEKFYANYVRDPACIDQVNKVSRCQVVLTPPVSASGSCQDFMVKYLNYNGCATAHRTDSDFLGNTWRIYLGHSPSMWRSTHELVKLLDQNGKTVDAFAY